MADLAARRHNAARDAEPCLHHEAQLHARDPYCAGCIANQLAASDAAAAGASSEEVRAAAWDAADFQPDGMPSPDQLRRFAGVLLAPVRAENDRLRRERLELIAAGTQDANDLRQQLATEADTYRRVIADVFDGMECRPECNSYGHAENCPAVNAPAAFATLRQQLVEAERRLAEATQLLGAALEQLKAAGVTRFQIPEALAAAGRTEGTT